MPPPQHRAGAHRKCQESSPLVPSAGGFHTFVARRHECCRAEIIDGAGRADQERGES